MNLINKYKTIPVQIKASFWFLFCSFLQKGISTLTTPIFTRLLTTEEYGQFSVFNSWLSIVTVFVTLHISGGIYTQGLIKFEDDRKKYASALQGLTTILVLFWSIIYFLFLDFWNELFSLTTIQMICMLLIIWASAIWGFWASQQRVDYNYKNLVILTVIVSIVKPLVGVVSILLADDNVTARIIGLAIVDIVAYSGLFICQIKDSNSFFSKKYWKYALSLCIPLIPHYLSQIVLGSSDRIMIQKMIGDDEAGIYSLAYSISLVMTLFNTALSQTISPWMYRKIKNRKIKEIGNITYLSMIIIAGLNLLLIMFAPEVVALFAPKEYYDAIWIIPPVAMSSFFIFSYDFFARFEFYYEKTKFIAFASVMGAILNIVLNYILIEIYGYYAAGYTTLICYIVYVICHYLAMRKICKDYLNNEQPFELSKLLIIAAGFMLCGFGILYTYNNVMLRYSIILITLLVIVILRKQIYKVIKDLISLKKKEN